MSITSRIQGFESSLAIKAPCSMAAIGNVPLSGLSVVDSAFNLTPTEGERVLVMFQSDARQNGIYVATTGAWSRATDFNGARDAVKGTYVRVNNGSRAGLWYLNVDNPIRIGTTPLFFTKVLDGSVPSLGSLSGTSDDIMQGGMNLFLTPAERTKLSGIAAGAEQNVNADWNAVSGAAAILNKPIVGTLAAQNANDITVTGGNATLTGGTFEDVFATDIHARGASGVLLKNQSGAIVASYGVGGGVGLTFNGAITFGGVTFTAVTGNDSRIVSGTAGANGHVVTWNADGDAVGSGIAVADVLQVNAIGVSVQGYDADIIKADETKTLVTGFDTNSYDLGTISFGTVTPSKNNGHVQHYINAGAHILSPPATVTVITLEITNNASAGAITTSGFTIVDGAFTSTNGHKFICDVRRTHSITQLSIKAAQ